MMDAGTPARAACLQRHGHWRFCTRAFNARQPRKPGLVAFVPGAEMLITVSTLGLGRTPRGGGEGTAATSQFRRSVEFRARRMVLLGDSFNICWSDWTLRSRALSQRGARLLHASAWGTVQLRAQRSTLHPQRVPPRLPIQLWERSCKQGTIQ